MSEPLQVNEHGLTAEQEQEVLTAYGYVDEYEVSEDDLKRAREMFKTPEDFKLLRKIIGQHMLNEQGLTYKSAHKLHEAGLENLEAYAIETAVSQLADERIRTALLTFYMSMRGHVQGEMTKEFKAANDALATEKKLNEEFEEEQEQGKQVVGPNL